MSLFPMVAFDLVPSDPVDDMLKEWGHFLGPCNRPFGRQSFALSIHGAVLAVAVSASTVSRNCGPYLRQEIVELARLCCHPDHGDLSRVALRLWRKIAPAAWEADYWKVRALVSYSEKGRHSGDLYRFDGWTRVKDCPEGVAGGGWSKGTKIRKKVLWAWELTPPSPAK